VRLTVVLSLALVGLLVVMARPAHGSAAVAVNATFAQDPGGAISMAVNSSGDA
jgi:hydrogenase/urease accessory protein HupE